MPNQEQSVSLISVAKRRLHAMRGECLVLGRIEPRELEVKCPA
ncbi:hypothetical protein BN903_16 [Halorubrum sp. AJ67]|nr:hypothetical protein BN903_16 [Halorubrum sp. AJ67]